MESQYTFNKSTSNNQEYWYVRFSWTVVKVDAADDNHAEGNDYGDAAGDCTSNSSKQKKNHLDDKIDDIS